MHKIAYYIKVSSVSSKLEVCKGPCCSLNRSGSNRSLQGWFLALTGGSGSLSNSSQSYWMDEMLIEVAVDTPIVINFDHFKFLNLGVFS